jgi:hypothetical protein
LFLGWIVRVHENSGQGRFTPSGQPCQYRV